ncbi:MAG: hypothetical protein A2297_03850 [Elusimicrobia bacterium RIFOXYB2_FULL_48_7]|nr:MAG: hypothetical protein A2297_03850 [Elusimicrobia bacterium RIFOXYB2_FULL_48_7]
MNKYLNKLSFRTKILLAVWLVAILIVSVALLIRSKQIENILKERMALRTDVITDVISFSIGSENILNENIIEKYSKFILSEAEIGYVLFFDKNDKLIKIAGKCDKKQVTLKTDNIFNSNDNYYDVYEEIRGKDRKKLGSIIVGFPMESLRQALKTDIITGIAVWLLAIILMLFLTHVLLIYLFRPVEYLFEGAVKIENKEFSYRIPVINDDEIGKISAQFNIMAEHLQNFYADLENKVKEAVNDLQKANNNLKERTEDLEKLNRKLEEVDKRKSEFVSIVSHDLKTPLTSIMGFADTLANKNLKLSDEDRASYLNIIRMESRRLARLISDFLDLSKIEEGILQLKIEKTDIRGVLDKIIRIIDARTKNIDIQIEVSPDVNDLNLDKDRITQVFQNLLVNAINHSPANSQIKIAVARQPGEIQISMADQGPGIPDNEKENIFNKFYRIDNDVSRKERGTGLGLTIAKSIVGLHGGKIWVENNKPTGSCFRFTLPQG